VLGVAAAFVVGVVLLVMWRRGQSVKTEQSDAMAIQAVGLFTNGQFQESLDHANSIRSQFPGSRGAVMADYVGAKAQMQLGLFVDAERAFRDYLKESSKEPFFEQAAQHGLAASLEGQRRFAEAAQMYEDLAAEAPEGLVDQTLLDAARAHELSGSLEQARSLLETVIQKDGIESRRARVQLAGLEAAANPHGEGRVPVAAPASPDSVEAGVEGPGASRAPVPEGDDTAPESEPASNTP
jgi:tetratricopeptide (TPR) repeat protein